MRAMTRCAGFAVLAAAALVPMARADEAVTWLDVAAERPIDHAAMVKHAFAADHARVTVRGPVAIVSAAGSTDGAACFTAYRIADPADEPPRIVDAHAKKIRLGAAEFLLVPAKRLADGPAAGGGGGVYEARPILDPPQPGGIEADRPTHVCLPVDYRHHFERVPVADPHRGLVIFAPRDRALQTGTLSIVDDFGTNRLVPGGGARRGTWTPVRTQDEP